MKFNCYRHSLLLTSLREVRIWSHLGWRDLRAQYARTRLGPWWVTTSLAATVTGSSLAIGLISDQSPSTVAPRLAIGLLIWTFISSTLNEAAGLFEIERSLLLNSTISELSLVLRVVWRNCVIFLHNLPVVALTLIISQGTLPLNVVFFLPLALLTALVMLFPLLVFARLSLWQRDLKSFLPAAIQVAFFLTPILWIPPEHGILYVLFRLNPAAWLIVLSQSLFLEGELRVTLLAWLIASSCLSILFLELMRPLLRNVRKLI